MRKTAIVISTVEQFEGLDENAPRWRSASISDTLKARGYDVTIMTSSWNHYQKKKRSKQVDGFIVVPTFAYYKHVSVTRVLSYFMQIPFFCFHLLRHRPDLVVVTVPALEHVLCVSFCRLVLKKTRFVFDYRDLWPEIFAPPLQRLFGQRVGQLVMGFYKNLRRRAFEKADLITTISPLFASYLRTQMAPEYGYKVSWFPTPKPAQNYEARALKDKAVKDKIVFSYFGSFSARTTLLEFLALLMPHLPDNAVVHIGGSGEMADDVERFCQTDTRLHYHGLVAPNIVLTHLLETDYGLLPYPKSQDFTMSYPNKYLEYLAAGVKVVSRDLAIFDAPETVANFRPVILGDQNDLTFPKRSSRERKELMTTYKGWINQYNVAAALDILNTSKL